MHDPDPRPPMLPPPLLRFVKIVFGLLAAGIAAIGGVLTFVIGGIELWHALKLALAGAGTAGELDEAVVAVVKSIDAVLLGLVQFLLAAYLWQILDPAESLVDSENMERLEEAKQILCKVVLVIVAVRMLSALIHRSGPTWQHLVFPAGIAALAFATSSLSRAHKSERNGAGG